MIKPAIMFMATILCQAIAYAQKKPVIIKASNSKVSIRDDKELKDQYWTITPTARPDVYETLVSKGKKQVTFITDIDSISFTVEAGKTYSFIILLNNTDSAYTQITGIAPPRDFTKSQMDWLKKNSSAFSSVNATGENAIAVYSDIESFGRIASHSQIVALGESTHGTSEFFSMKHRLLEYAVVKLGFRVFAIEDNQLQVEIVNNYVLNGVGDVNKVMNGMFSVWNKQEVLDMIKWVRRYNINHPDKTVEFIGFDMQNPRLPLDSLSSYLKRTDQAVFANAEILLADFKKNWSNDFTIADSVKREWVINTTKLWHLVTIKKEEWMSAAKNKTEKKNIEWAIQNANVIKQCAKGKYQIGQGNILFRDSAMAENISWILSQRPPGTKMVIWAHDAHISRGDDQIASNNYYGGISMGSWLSKKYGNNYKAFGFETFSGTYSAHPSYTDYSKLIDCSLNQSPVGSLDKGLHAIVQERKAKGLILDMREVRNSNSFGKWLLQPLAIRFANHVCIPSQYELKYSVPYQFDGIIFIDKTSGSKPIN